MPQTSTALKDPSGSLSLLARAHSPTTAERIHTEKIIHRPLHLKPTEPSTAQTQRRALRAEKRALKKRKKSLRPAPLSSRQKKALGIYEIQKSAQKYEVYVPLHELWVRYIQDVLGLTVPGGGNGGGGGEEKREKRSVTPQDAAKLCAADFHGAELEVVRSRCVGRVGVRGIVVKDGRGAFDIVTRGKGGLKRVPKEGTWFAFEVPLPEVVGGEDGKTDVNEGEASGQAGKETKGEASGQAGKETRREEDRGKPLKFELHGDQFIYRATDRANRKFKTHFLKDL